MQITPYVPTASLWARRRKHGQKDSVVFSAAIQLTPALVAAADADGIAYVYFTANTAKTSPRQKQADYIGFVESQPAINVQAVDTLLDRDDQDETE